MIPVIDYVELKARRYGKVIKQNTSGTAKIFHLEESFFWILKFYLKNFSYSQNNEHLKHGIIRFITHEMVEGDETVVFR